MLIPYYSQYHLLLFLVLFNECSVGANMHLHKLKLLANVDHTIMKLKRVAQEDSWDFDMFPSSLVKLHYFQRIVYCQVLANSAVLSNSARSNSHKKTLKTGLDKMCFFTIRETQYNWHLVKNTFYYSQDLLVVGIWLVGIWKDWQN